MVERNGPIEILLVEDNPGDVRLTKEALKEGKVYSNLHTVKDGVEAMEFLRKQGKYKDVPRPDIILLDNMSPELLREAIKRRDRIAPDVPLEASGGITLGTVAAIAAAGVDRISVGALTHSAPALDIGLDYETGA